MRFPVTMLVLTVVAYTNLHSPCPAGEAPPLNLKGTRILVCAGYWDLMNIPAVRKLTAAGAEVRGGSLVELTWDPPSSTT